MSADPGIPGAAHSVRFNRREVGRHTAAPLLALLASGAGFLKFHDYSYFTPEVVICVIAIIVVSFLLAALAAAHRAGQMVVLAGVLTLVVDVQLARNFMFLGFGKALTLAGTFLVLIGLSWLVRQHADRLIALVAATVLVTTVLIPKTPAQSTAEPPASSGRFDLPLIVHVILDEHIGPDGLPPERSVPALRDALRSFYHSLGFRIFDAAYSEHSRSAESIAQVLNLSPGETHPAWVVPGTGGFTNQLASNVYFSEMMARGYVLRIHQSDFLRLCPEAGRAVCETYPATGLGVLQEVNLSVREKARLLAGAYLKRSKLVEAAAAAYAPLRLQAARAGIALPPWSWHAYTAPLNAMASFEQFLDAVVAARHGELHFAHLLIPHSPEAYNEDCSLRPVDRWVDIGDTPEARRAAYAEYDHQVRCTFRKIRQISEAIPAELGADAIFIVHGDHGSRLSLAQALVMNGEPSSDDDYRDAYSTLFAVRSPHLSGGSDTRFVPITCILRSLVHGQFQDLPDLDYCVERPAVFVTTRDGSVVRKPLAPFTRQP